MSVIITTNSNSYTIKLPENFSPNTKGTCELTGSRWEQLMELPGSKGNSFQRLSSSLASALLIFICMAEPIACPVDTVFPQLMLKKLFSFNFF